jgi:hypothetical protein
MSDMEEATSAVQPFFAIGRWKFVALALSTFNLYQLVWLWQHWRHRRKVVGEPVLPAVRALLFPWIFTIPLGYRIAKACVASGTAGWSPALTAAILWTLSSLGSAFLPDGSWLLLTFLPVLSGTWLQHLANRVNTTVVPAHDRNQQFTLANKVVVVIGGLAVLLLIAAEVFPPQSGAPVPPPTRYAEVLTDNATITSATSEGEVIGTVPRGTVLSLSAEQGAWFEVQLFSGEARYIRKASGRPLQYEPVAPSDSATRQQVFAALMQAGL